MTQEQLMKVKIKYLEDRITTLEKSLSERLHIDILGRFQDDRYKHEQGFKDIDTSDTFRDAEDNGE